MAFFSEIKAKLGLDISGFERGLSNAQKSGGAFAGKFGNQIAGTEKMGGALAAALGLNIQNIAEKFARLWTGVSEGAEKAFERIGKASDSATESIQKRLRLRNTDQQNIEQDIKREASLRKQAAKLLEGTTARGGGRGFGARVKVAATEEATADANEKLAEAEALALSIAERQKKIKEEAAKESIDATKKASEAREKAFEKEQKDEDELAKLQSENALNALSNEAKLAALKTRQAALYEEGSLQSMIEAENITKDIMSVEEKITAEKQKQIEKNKENTEELIKGVKEAEKLNQTLASQIDDQAKANFSEVAGGTRGTQTDRAKARRAESLRARARRVIDQGGDGAEERAAKLTAQADQIQQSLTSTKSTEKTSLTDDFVDAFDKARVLKAIEDLLKPTATI